MHFLGGKWPVDVDMHAPVKASRKRVTILKPPINSGTKFNMGAMALAGGGSSHLTVGGVGPPTAACSRTAGRGALQELEVVAHPQEVRQAIRTRLSFPNPSLGGRGAAECPGPSPSREVPQEEEQEGPGGRGRASLIVGKTGPHAGSSTALWAPGPRTFGHSRDSEKLVFL